MFSTMDLRSGYWQVSVEPRGKKRLFLELQMAYETCLCYSYEIIIPSSDVKEHCKRLSSVLTGFQQHNLRVEASKCSFGPSRAPFLGHVVSAQGVHTDPEKWKLLPTSLSLQTLISYVPF